MPCIRSLPAGLPMFFAPLLENWWCRPSESSGRGLRRHPKEASRAGARSEMLPRTCQSSLRHARSTAPDYRFLTFRSVVNFECVRMRGILTHHAYSTVGIGSQNVKARRKSTEFVRYGGTVVS